MGFEPDLLHGKQLPLVRTGARLRSGSGIAVTHRRRAGLGFDADCRGFRTESGLASRIALRRHKSRDREFSSQAVADRKLLWSEVWVRPRLRRDARAPGRPAVGGALGGGVGKRRVEVVTPEANAAGWPPIDPRACQRRPRSQGNCGCAPPGAFVEISIRRGQAVGAEHPCCWSSSSCRTTVGPAPRRALKVGVASVGEHGR
jgi:hypothetical protein